MWRFTMWVYVLSHTDSFIENSSPVYVGPGVDPATEDLRAVLRLPNLRSPEVPEDPLEGDELNVLSQLFARQLHVLSLFAGESDPKYGDELLKQVRCMNALYRLSFREPSKMHLSEAERSLVVEYIQATIENTRKGVEEGSYPTSFWEHILEANKRILNWKKQWDRQEL